MKIKISKLDKIFSKYIRYRDLWICQRCLKKYQPPTNGLQCSHYHGRRKRNVRFDPDNAVALCYGCHMHMTANPHEHTLFFQKRLGATKFLMLSIKANIKKKVDEKMIELWLKKHVEKLLKNSKKEGGLK